jgi:hypothetical protein
MNRDDFMKEARVTARDILQGKENGIMNLVQRAWAEGKRNAEVETLRAAIEEALDKREPKEQPVDAVYPTWGEWLHSMHVVGVHAMCAPEPNFYYPIDDKFNAPIPADIAEKLGLQPKEGTCTD